MKFLHFLKQKIQSPGTFISKHTWDPSQKAITKYTDRQLKNNWMCELDDYSMWSKYTNEKQSEEYVRMRRVINLVTIF